MIDIAIVLATLIAPTINAITTITRIAFEISVPFAPARRACWGSLITWVPGMLRSIALPAADARAPAASCTTTSVSSPARPLSCPGLFDRQHRAGVLEQHARVIDAGDPEAAVP